MQRHRVLIAFGLAWLSALLLSWWVYARSTARETTRDVATAVVATRDIPVGKRIEPADLKTVSLERRDFPRTAFAQTTDVVDRAVAVPIAAGDLVLSGKLAAKGSGEGLVALIEPGTRAISVQVNEISGVSGFIQPGTRVDVIFTRVFSNGDAATTTILQNVKVLAYGRQLDTIARPETANAQNAARPTVATLLVTQDEAERLVLAGQRGRIQLVLRNALDEEILEPSEPVNATDLGIEDPQRARAAAARPVVSPEVEANRIAALVAARMAQQQNQRVRMVRVFRGEKMTEERFQ